MTETEFNNVTRRSQINKTDNKKKRKEKSNFTEEDFLSAIDEIENQKFEEIEQFNKQTYADVSNDPEFLKYKEDLHKFPYYTFLTDEEQEMYNKLDAPINNVSIPVVARHPFTWVKWIIGIRPRDYQFKILNDLYKYKRVACVSSRQIGKSFGIGGFSFWAAYNNVFPSGVDGRTNIVVISRTEDQAKKLLRNIFKMVKRADKVYDMNTKGTKMWCKDKFTSSSMVEKPTLFKLEWSGGSIEISPPTDKVLGDSISIVFIDEADKLKTENPDYLFYSSIMPTVKATKGSVFLFSTLKGTPTFFYEIINPEEESPGRGWNRIWLPWTVNEDDWGYGWEERKRMIAEGKEIYFKTEYEASFASGEANFFDLEAVERMVDNFRKPIREYNGSVTVGLDYGSKTSRTVATFIAEEDKFKILWYKEFPEAFDNSKLVQFFKEESQRYRIKKIIVDDCPAGDTPSNLLKQAGFNLKMFGFKKDKIRTYENVKIAMCNDRIEMYPDKEFISQIKGIEEKQSKTGYQIEKSKGFRDDICDSFILALSEYTKPRRHGKRRIL
jgi:hypothetical protein